MEQIITGSIIVTKLGDMGNRKYGFLSIETETHEQYEVKVSAYTTYDTLDIGEQVQIEGETLGNKGIFEAKRITRKA